MPVVIVGSRGDEALGRRMLREGAQDFVVREEIDCGPLARTLRNALDRQRFFNASQRGSTLHSLTAFYNERGFQAAASREMKLAAEAGQPLLLVLAEVDNLAELTEAYGREQRELTLLEASELLRAGGGEAALLGCFEGSRFAALLWNRRADEFIGAVQAKHAEQPRPYAFAFGWALTHPGAYESFDPLLTAAEASLCENGGSSPTPGPLHSMQPTASAAASRA
jgi:PleD family two-component response regulator